MACVNAYDSPKTPLQVHFAISPHRPVPRSPLSCPVDETRPPATPPSDNDRVPPRGERRRRLRTSRRNVPSSSGLRRECTVSYGSPFPPDSAGAVIHTGQSQISDALAKIGPQIPTESGLAARIRFHQSWYRLNLLGLNHYGRTGPNKKGRPLGSILSPEAATAGLNFSSTEAQLLYEWRRTIGWGVDPVRCTSYLTSSQALTLNMFGPLSDSPSWTERIMGEILKAEVTGVESVDVEYAPAFPSQYLGDKTRVDAWVRLHSSEGPLAAVFEIKYADRFNSRHIDLSKQPKYRELAETTGLWDLNDARTASRTVNQLIRCHALAAASWLKKSSTTNLPRIVVVYHASDQAALRVIEQYRSILLLQDLLIPLELTAFFDLMTRSARSADQLKAADRLKDRYTSFHLSEHLWEHHRARQKRDRA